MPVCPECHSGSGLEQDSTNPKYFYCKHCKSNFILEKTGMPIQTDEEWRRR